MGRYFGCALLVAVGVVMGFISGSYQPSNAQQPPAAVADEADVAEQLKEIKEIKTQVHEINTLLKSGKLRVVVSIYPDAK